MDEDKLYEEAIKFWGDEKQLRVVQEECAELIVAISHFLRSEERQKEWGKPDDGSFDKLAGEAADVYIMVKQLMKIVGEDKVQDMINYKLKRVEDKLKKYQLKHSLEKDRELMTQRFCKGEKK